MLEFIKLFLEALFGTKKETVVVAEIKTYGLIKYDSKNAEAVKYAKKRLNAHGFGPLDESNPNFLGQMQLKVKAFQKAKGLSSDGEIGPKTWAELNKEPVKVEVPPNDIASMLISRANSQVGVRESGDNNKGKEVEEFQKVVDGKAQGEAWCMAFMQWVSKKTCDQLNVKNPLYPTEHCYTLWNNTPEKYRLSKPKKGAVMIQVTKTKGKYNGHTGICTGGFHADGKNFSTIEGNTNGAGSSEGDGVYKKTRSIDGSSSMTVKGFVDLPRMIEDLMK